VSGAASESPAALPAGTAPARVRLRAGIRKGVPFGVAVFATSISFGILAEPVMGRIAPIVMSIIVFSGSAQFGSLAVLSAGGTAAAAIGAGTMLNARFLAMGIALAPSLAGRALRRAGFGLSTVDASWAAASRGDGSFDPFYMLGVTVPQYPLWVLGTVIGVLVGDSLGSPKELGLDALFPAFFVGLIYEEVSDRPRVAAAAGGAIIALALVPFVPPGIPIVAAGLAAIAVSRSKLVAS
jgi:predicted branched-subunit amino acid permease